MRLVSRGLVLLLITTDFERLAALDRVHVDLLAGRALEAKDNLLRGLSLLVEHRLGLATVTALLAVVTTLPLRVKARLARLVLRHLVRGVLLAALAEGLLRFRHL
jgi:hypothetical protein